MFLLCCLPSDDVERKKNGAEPSHLSGQWEDSNLQKWVKKKIEIAHKCMRGLEEKCVQKCTLLSVFSRMTHYLLSSIDRFVQNMPTSEH